MSAVIEARGLGKTFRTGRRTVHAVQDVSLSVSAGEALGELDLVMPRDGDHDGMGDRWEEAIGLLQQVRLLTPDDA